MRYLGDGTVWNCFERITEFQHKAMDPIVHFYFKGKLIRITGIIIEALCK